MYFTTSPASAAPDKLCKKTSAFHCLSEPSVVKSEKRNTEFAEVHRGAQRNPSRTARSEWPSWESFSIELPPRRTRSLLAGLGRLWTLRVEPALFIAADPFVRPESFENELRRRGHPGRPAAAVGAHAFDLLHQSLNPLELRQGFRGRSAFRHFQFASLLKPLHDGLQIRALQILRENFSDGAAD